MTTQILIIVNVTYTYSSSGCLVERKQRMFPTVSVVVAATIVLLLLILSLYSRRSPAVYRSALLDKAIQTQSACSRFWDIPEVVLFVVVQLPRHDQLSVVLTCRFLRDVATPVLWRNLVGHRPSSQLFNILPKVLSDWDYQFDANLIGVSVHVVGSSTYLNTTF